MLNDIYNKRIIELAGNIPRLGRLADPDASATAHSKLCGSTVKIDLKMDGPVVTDFAHDVKACALGQASSSIMASHVVGSTASELRDLRETVRRMLKENGAPPQGKWADIGFLEPVRDYKARHASTMLTFDAVVDAIGQIEAKVAARRNSRFRRRDNQRRYFGMSVRASGGWRGTPAQPSYFAGAGTAAPPVGAVASAVLVDFPTCGPVATSATSLTRRSCTCFGSQRRDRRRRPIGPREHLRNGIGGHQIGEAQFGLRQFVQVFPRRHVQGQQQQITRPAHVERIFGKPSDIALDDHQILRRVARCLGVVGAVSHPDLMHPHMRG